MGRTEPRLWTPPLRALTPDTTVGYSQVAWARSIGRPFLPWQEFAVVHGGELMPDGRPRFRIVIVLVARQNGKTEIPSILSTYWLAVERSPLILGTSTKIEYARETWDKTRKIILKSSAFHGEYDPKRWYVRGAGDTSMWLYERDNDGEIIEALEGPRYKIAAANEEGGRSLSVHRGIVDEWRQHRDRRAWDAIEPAASYWDSQIWCLSNAGDANSAVLNEYQDAAEHFIATGEGDPRVGLFAWTADPELPADHPDAILQANPRVGYGGPSLEDLQAQARAAIRAGGETLTGFQTEKLCIRVKRLNPAIDPGSWLRARQPGTLDEARSRLAACLDVSPDGAHITLAVAGVLPSGHVRGEIAGAWDSLAKARLELPALLERIKPKRLTWYPDGPGAVLAAELAKRPGWPPRGIVVEPIRGDTAAACMGLETLVREREFLHSGDLLLDAHVAECERKKRGDRWVFVRADEGHIDAAYAMAGAAHTARTMPAPVGKPRLVVAD